MQSNNPGTGIYAINICFLVVIFVTFVSPAWSASVSQRTTGSCSPAVADVKGNVSVVCTGVDPAVLNDAVKLLNEILKDTKQIPHIRQELERASKRTDQLETQRKPRRVTPNQQRQLSLLLSGKPPHPIEVSGLANNGESMQYAEELAITLQSAGWPVKTLGAYQMIGRIPVGLHIWYKDEDGAGIAAQLLGESLRKAGLEVTVEERPRRTSSIINIMVGSKPD